MEHSSSDATRAATEIDRRIGDVLRTVRQTRELSLRELGQRIGVAYQQIMKYETGVTRIPAATLYRLAQILRCDIAVFFDDIDKTKRELAADVSPEDALAARSWGRIEDPVVREALRGLLISLDSSQKLD